MSDDAAPTVPARVLAGEEEAGYVRRLREILGAARLGSHYPDGTRLSEHVGVLAPEVHRGLYPGLEVDLRSGLPTYREWTRAQTDVRVAEDQLRQLGPRGELERAGASAGDPREAAGEARLLRGDCGAALAPLGR